MNNLSSYCGLVDAKMRASDKDLPVVLVFKNIGNLFHFRHLSGDLCSRPNSQVESKQYARA
jgi:hypothetical protein